MLSRAAKNNALKAIQYNIEEDGELELEEASNIDNIHSSSSNKTPFVATVKTQNAPLGQTLDLVKQYSRKIEYCSRELIRIHNKALDIRDQGS